ncbi:MAG: 40S ribosomal protein S19 [Candidatus Pacearchaeota archaeon]
MDKEYETNPVYGLDPQEYNLKLAEALKKIPEFKKPEWVDFVKSGPSRLRPIEDEDFWYKRAASILRQIYKNEVVGVNRLRTRYGSKKKRGSKPEEFRKGGGKIIRTILQELDKLGFTEIVKTPSQTSRVKRSGRRLTQKGKKFLEEIR